LKLPAAAVQHASSASGGRKHKGSAERLLIVARARIGSCLDSPGLSAVVREELEAAESSLRAVELEIGKRRNQGAQWRNLLNDTADNHADTRNFLLQNFTNFDAEGDMVMMEAIRSQRASPSSSSGLPWDDVSFGKPDANGSSARAAGGSDDSSERIRNSSALAQELLTKSGHLDFDALSFSKLPVVEQHPLQFFAVHWLRSNGIIRDLHQKGWVPQKDEFQEKVLRYLGEIDGLYVRDAVYHGSAHGTDVMAAMEWFLRLPFLRDRTTMLDHFMGVISAAIHDVGHPGLNNLFQSKTMAPLAVRYNDKSILENMHVSLAFEVMQRDDSCNWFALLPKAFRRTRDPSTTGTVNLQQYMRRGMIGMVLATDMASHTQNMTAFQNLVKDDDEKPVGSPEEMKQEAVDHKLFLLETMLHAADISNPCKPHEQMLKWTELVLLEFWNQGDEERRLGLPVSPLCDREAGRAAVPKGQLGFINFVIRPFYSLIVELMPQAQEATDNLALTLAFWEERDREKATFEDIFGDDGGTSTFTSLANAPRMS